MGDKKTVTISQFVDQTKCELLGHQAFYADGSNKFYKNIGEIPDNIVSNPLIDIKQVGKEFDTNTIINKENNMKKEIEILLSKAENGSELFNTSSLFNFSINSIARGANPIRILEQIVLSADEKQRHFLEYISYLPIKPIISVDSTETCSEILSHSDKEFKENKCEYCKKPIN